MTSPTFTRDRNALLESLARRYCWWQAPAEALRTPRRIVARVMEMGDYSDVERLGDVLGDSAFRDALQHAEAGEFSPRSWHYWHYRLGLAHLGEMPPLPQRRFG